MNRRNMIAAGVASLSAATVTSSKAQKPAESNPELADVKVLLKAHDDAMTGHDLDGVLATLADDVAIMGTGPGEMWSGTDEVKVAYEHFFMVFDKGEQDFSYNFRTGNLGADMGWMVTSGTVKGKLDSEEFAYPLNVSLTVAKKGGAWKIQAMHFSTLTSGEVTA
ncbi:MAG: nuclear transport factor 2 family protein [Verrucomicrobiales bacterium]|nr:nuclear transport factor 2 family protein [Verrucomicrobiales bacterium]